MGSGIAGWKSRLLQVGRGIDGFASRRQFVMLRRKGGRPSALLVVLLQFTADVLQGLFHDPVLERLGFLLLLALFVFLLRGRFGSIAAHDISLTAILVIL